MNHIQIYKKFTRIFPLVASIEVYEWFPNGKNSIRIRHFNDAEYVFTYIDNDDWVLETLDSYIKKMKGEKTKTTMNNLSKPMTAK